MARCSAGFFVSIVWIMAIADEVVNVLRTFGFVFGLSEAIIGLTIFAVGNSLADLVANMTVAVSRSHVYLDNVILQLCDPGFCPYHGLLRLLR